MGRRAKDSQLYPYRLLSALLCATTISAHAIPGAAPVSDLQSSWSYNCYSPGQACRGNTGNTQGGGHGAHGCSSISASGCSQYSYNGGGQFKLCQYSDANCGTVLESGPNGGTVSCVVFGGAHPRSYKIVNRDSNC